MLQSGSQIQIAGMIGEIPAPRKAAEASRIAIGDNAPLYELSQSKISPWPGSAYPPDWQLRPARVHEAEGQGALAFALYQMTQHRGAILLITLARQPWQLMPVDLPQGVSERLLLIRAKSEEDLLWATEEALRSAPVGLVIVQPEKPLSLTTGRRLQLAAEAGQTTGILLISTGQGSNAAETRWQCDPKPGSADSTPQNWILIKNKSGTLKGWTVDWDGKAATGHRIHEVCE